MDREKIIKGLEIQLDDLQKYADANEMLTLTQGQAKEIVALLKEPEAIKPTWSRGRPFCGACGLRIRGGKFCSDCGKPIFWEGKRWNGSDWV